MSKFNRKSHLSRLGVSAGIGALAIITGACSDNAGTDADAGATDPGGETEAAAPAEEAPAASTDGEGSTDMTAPEPAAEEPVSTDSEESGAY